MDSKSRLNFSKKENKASFVNKALFLVISIVSVLACIKTIFISLDIDESYAMAVGYRLATGDRFFKDLWEAHQLGGFFIAPFLRLFLSLTGSTSYIVIYARVLGTLLHLGIGYYLYITLGEHFSSKLKWLLFFIHINFLPKWVQIPEFEIQQYWFILLQFLFLFHYFVGDNKKRKYLVLAGFMIFLQMFSYPTLILLYPFLSVCIFQLEKRDEIGIKQRIKDILYFTSGALIPGICFIGYLCSYMSVSEFFTYVSYIFQDESHTLVQASVKWKIFFAQFLQIWEDSMLTMILSGVVTIVYAFFFKEKHMQKMEQSGAISSGWKRSMHFFVCSLIFMLSMQQSLGCLLGNENQFYMLWRFFVISCLGIFLIRIKRNRIVTVLTCFAIIPGFLVLMSVLIMTNMDINTSMAKMFISVIGVLLLLASIQENSFVYSSLYSMLLGFLVCKLLLIRVSGCLEVTVLAPLQKIPCGPAAGIYMLEDTATVLIDDYQELTKLLTPEDALLYVGGENIVYLWTDAKVATPSTQGTNAYNEMFTEYFQLFPDKLPSVIAIDKELGENPIYYNSPQNNILFEWIEKEYDYTEKIDSNYMTFYVKNKRKE